MKNANFLKNNFFVAIVDDDKDSHVFLKRTIQRINPNHTIISFYDGKSLMLYLSEIVNSEQQLPDLIILDLSMPEMDGYEVLKMLREKFKETRVFVLTAGQYEYDRIKSIAYGCTNYYMKAMDAEELKQRIEDMFLQMENPSLETTVLQEETKRQIETR